MWAIVSFTCDFFKNSFYLKIWSERLLFIMKLYYVYLSRGFAAAAAPLHIDDALCNGYLMVNSSFNCIFSAQKHVINSATHSLIIKVNTCSASTQFCIGVTWILFMNLMLY